MPGRQGHLHARLAEILSGVPAGRVIAIASLARHLAVPVPQALAMSRGLGEADGAPLPWHRVVADGGAIGRHKLRDLQIALLRAEGVTVSAAGVVQDFATRVVADFDNPGAAANLESSAHPGGSGTVFSRARGRLTKPRSTVGQK